MFKRIISFVAFALISFAAVAQSSPGLTYGQIPTAAQWNSYFSSKQNFSSVGFFDANSNLVISYFPPLINSGFSAGPTLLANNTAAFKIIIGSSPTASGVLTMPSTTNTWACSAEDITSNATLTVGQTATSATSVTLHAYSRTTGLSSSFNTNDVVLVKCTGI